MFVYYQYRRLMLKHNPKTMSGILENRKLLTKPLFRHARYLQQLGDIVRACLPSPLNEHCQVANCSHTELTLATSTPAWSTRLRYHTPGILRLLGNQIENAPHRVKIIIIPCEEKPTRTRVRNVQKPSPQSAALLQETAQHIQHPELQASLLRLSRNIGRKAGGGGNSGQEE